MQRIRYQAASKLIGAECPHCVGQKAMFNTAQPKIRFAL
jgi:hypothetical protein